MYEHAEGKSYVGLTANNALYFDNRLISNTCTSFEIEVNDLLGPYDLFYLFQ